MQLYFAALALKDKNMKKLVRALQKSGFSVTVTTRGHVRVFNKETNQQVILSSGRTKDRRTILEIRKNLKDIGYDAKKDGVSIG
jgi:predicted RNA binding protein YcfA (HicA-like mRNA interferase family)